MPPASTSSAPRRPTTLSCEDLLRLQSQSEASTNRGTRLFFDLRDRHAWKAGSIPGASHVPASVGVAQLRREIDRNQDKGTSPRVCLVCQRGVTAARVADELSQQADLELEVLEEGIDGWVAAGGTLKASDEGPYNWSWQAIRDQFPIVQRTMKVLDGRELPLLYLDHAASTHPPSRVTDALYRFVSLDYANIHRGTHLLSREATDRFDDCYGAVARFLGGDLERNSVIFANNTTQAIDIAAYAMSSLPGHTLVSGLEHHSNDLPHRRRGEVEHWPLCPDGSLDMQALERILKRGETKLVAVSGGSNVSGWMPDLDRIAELAHAHGAKVLVDAAQRIAHQRLDVHPNDDPRHLDFVVGAGHKCYSPFGSGFLFAPRDLMDSVEPYLPGGGTASAVHADSVDFVSGSDRHQGGTPNIGGVITLAESLCFLSEIGMDRVREHEKELMRHAFSALKAMPEVTIYGPQDPDERLAVFCFNVKGVSDLKAAAILSEEYGIACRNGRFCAHLHMDKLLEQQGGYNVEEGGSPGAVRASFGLFNTLNDVDRFIAAVDALRKGEWKGDYKLGAGAQAKESLGRCNDRWMEVNEKS